MTSQATAGDGGWAGTGSGDGAGAGGGGGWIRRTRTLSISRPRGSDRPPAAAVKVAIYPRSRRAVSDGDASLDVTAARDRRRRAIAQASRAGTSLAEEGGVSSKEAMLDRSSESDSSIRLPSNSGEHPLMLSASYMT